MSNATHTPGEWQANVTDGSSRATVTSSRGFHIATCTKQDARLIAAARELLAALQEAEPFLRSGDVDTRGGKIELSRLADKFAAAIAKATGDA